MNCTLKKAIWFGALISIFGLLTHFAIAAGSAPETKFVTIGTGGVTGVYYPAGGAICSMVYRHHKETGLRCSVESTGGSEYNINALRQGDIDLGIVQSDFQYHAWNGTSHSFQPYGPFKKLRSLFSLHSESFTIVARKDAHIHTYDDLKGKRVNIGNPGSGSLGMMEMLMKKKGWTRDDFALASQLKASEQGEALCNGRIDAFVYVSGHPNSLLQEVTSSCDVSLVSVTGKEVDELIKENPFYVKTVVPGGMYKGTTNDAKSFGVRATLVASEDMDEEAVYQVVKSVFEHLDDFRTLHPVLATLEKEEMVRDGLTAPLHKGAKRYYCENGMLSGVVCDKTDSVTNDQAPAIAAEEPGATKSLAAEKQAEKPEDASKEKPAAKNAADAKKE